MLLSRWFQRRSSFSLSLSLSFLLFSPLPLLFSSSCFFFFLFFFLFLSPLYSLSIVQSFPFSPSLFFSFFLQSPSPVFIGKNRGRTSQWGGHCWPPPPLSISGEKGGKWASNGRRLIAPNPGTKLGEKWRRKKFFSPVLCVRREEDDGAVSKRRRFAFSLFFFS